MRTAPRRTRARFEGAGDIPPSPDPLADGEPDRLSSAAMPLRGTATGGPPEEASDSALSASAINLVAGAWLVVAPWVLGYAGAAARWNDVACGGAIGLLALVRLSGLDRVVWPSLVNAVIAIWLLVATFTIDTTSTEWINDLILGAAVGVLALWSAASSESVGAAHAAPRRPRAPLPPDPAATATLPREVVRRNARGRILPH